MAAERLGAVTFAGEFAAQSRHHIATLAGLAGVVLIAIGTRTPWLQRWDDAIERLADRHRLRLRHVAGAATLTGEKLVHPSIAIVSAIALIRSHPGAPMRFLAPLAVASLGGIATHHLVKFIYHRPRPEIALKRDKTEGAYPSGHTTNATSVVVTSLYLLAHEGVLGANVAVPLGVVLCLATGMSRVVLGWHWATDVLGGWMAGTAVASLATALYLALR